MEKKIYPAKCLKTGQYFLLETEQEGGREQVVNFTDISDDQAKTIGGGSAWKDLRVSVNLRPCRWCGSRAVAGCSCQRKKGACPDRGTYSYQCIFCDQLVPDTAVVSDIKKLRLSVTSPHFDNIGAVLETMGLQTRPFREAGFDCDILFLNCGTSDSVDPGKFRTFIQEGGCAYVSDWAFTFLKDAFPGAITCEKKGVTGKVPAQIMDREIQSVVGSEIEVNYDLPLWAKIRSHKGKCMIQGKGFINNLPMMVVIREGKGTIFYTSFHNHAQASEKEVALLKTMLARQIGTVCNTSTEDVIRILGLNITESAKISR